MEKRVQRKKAESGSGVDLGRSKSPGKPKRTPQMERALLRSKQESQDFASGVLSFRLEQEPLDQLMSKANLLGLSAGQLARSWIIERLNQQEVSGFSAEQNEQIARQMYEIAVKTFFDMKTELSTSNQWTEQIGLRKGVGHWTDEGMFQLSCDVFSKQAAEHVVKDTLSLLRSCPINSAKPVEVPAPDLEILASLAFSALKAAEGKEERS
jgi:hypothetical protein